MKVVPLGENVVIRRIDPAVETAGGIILPDSAQDKPQEGRVLSIGDGKLLNNGSRSAHQVEEGDRVLFGQFSGTEIGVDGQELIIMSESEILAIIK